MARAPVRRFPQRPLLAVLAIAIVILLAPALARALGNGKSVDRNLAPDGQRPSAAR